MEPLPIDPALPTIVDALRRHGAVVVEAPPGAGKTTRVPAALAARLERGRQIVVLEPRRLAARLAAARVASELGEPVGERVGYQVRFESVSGPHTRIRFVTEGLLLRQLATDPTLRDVGVVVLDEFHERHIAGDLVLAWSRELRQGGARPDLGIVVMSATLDAAPVARFLDDCPVIRVQGRRFDVDVEHRDRPEQGPLGAQVARAVGRLVHEGLDGDVLVFLPGAAEIRESRSACARLAADEGLELVALHGELASAEQDRALARSARRKVILSTNVAESSVTVEGVVAVVDSGLARIAGHAPWSGMPTLRVQPISQASARQRAGRAGRTRAGRCLRLYSARDFAERREQDAPEIVRLDLADALLTLAALGVGAPRALPLLDAPPAAALDAATRLLGLLGAVDSSGRLTAVGRSMARLPVHPRAARLLVEAERRGVLGSACDLAALLGERGIELRPASLAGSAEGRHRSDARGSSDLTSLVELVGQARRARFDPSALRSMGIDPVAVRTVERASRQLASIVGRASATLGAAEADPALRLSLLSGFPDRVARRVRDAELHLATGGSAWLAPTSEVKDAALLVAVDAEERNDGRGRRTVVRLASAIEPDWLLELFPAEVRESAALEWNEALERVELVERLCYESLVLDQSRTVRGGSTAVAARLAAEAERRGPAAFAAALALERLYARVAFVREAVPEAGLPELGEAEAREELRALCQGRHSFEELRRAGLLEALAARLDGAARRALESSAPERIRLPSGRELVVQYERGKPPWVASRLQDFFGMKQGPAIAHGRVSLVLHLLAPNRRAVQVTSDLGGFWDRTYGALRKELCRRYPKHDWPADGRTATAPPPGRLRAR